jgi:hypothetical protein
VTRTPEGDGTRIRWAATWAATVCGRFVSRGVRTFLPSMLSQLVAVAEKQAGASG